MPVAWLIGRAKEAMGDVEYEREGDMTQAGDTTSRSKKGSTTGWMLLLVLLPAILYTAWVLGQMRAVERRNMRLLDRAVSRIDHVLTACKSSVQNLFNDLKYVEDFFDRQPYLDEPGAGELGKLRNLAASESLRKESPDSENDELLVAVDFSRSEADLVLLARWQEDPSSGRKAATVGIKVNLEKILRGLPLDREFDHLFVADENEDVILHYEPPWFGKIRSGLRIHNLGQLLPREQADRSDRDESITEAAGIRRLGEALFGAEEVRNEEYRFYSQPLQLELYQQDGLAPVVKTWKLYGLVPIDRTLRQAAGIAPAIVLGLILVLIVAVLAIPFLKLAFMDRRERFRHWDAYLLALGTFCVLQLCGIILVALDANLHLREQAEESLERLADSVDGALESSLRSLREQLQHYDTQLCQRGLVPLPDGVFEDTKLLAKTGVPESPAADQLGLDRAAYPLFASVFWIDSAGDQFAKANIRGHNTPPVSVRRRSYFQAVVQGRLSALEGGADVFFSSHQSITTGERFCALSLRSCLSSDGGTVAAAITGETDSVMYPVLPPGYGFTIIGDDGKSHFHSDGRRALEENLFDELKDTDRLAAAMLSGSDEHFDTSYLNRRHKIFIRPLESRPWWIVTFYDTEILNTIFMEAVVDAAALAILYTLCLVTPIVLMYGLVLRRKPSVWLWPSTARVGLYRRLALVLVGLMVLFLMVQRKLDGDAAIALCLLLPAVTCLLSLVVYRQERMTISLPGAGKVAWLKLPWPGVRGLFWYVACTTLFWLLVGILPGVSMLNLTWKDQLASLFKHETQDLADRLDDRYERIKKHYSDVEVASTEEQAIAEHSACAGDLHQASLLGTDVVLSSLQMVPISPETAMVGHRSAQSSPAAALRGLGWTRFLDRYTPFVTDQSGLLRYRWHAATAGGSWWRSAEHGLLYLPRKQPPLPFHIVSDPLRVTPELGLLSVLGALLLVAALVMWNLYCARRLFFQRIGEEVAPISIEDLAEHRLKKNVIAILTSPFDRRAVVGSGGVYYLDLARAEGDPVSEVSESDQTVVCDHFAAGLDDREQRLWKLEQLEQLITRDRKVIILCNRKPSEILLQAWREQGAGQESDEIPRWWHLLSAFEVKPMVLAYGPRAGHSDILQREQLAGNVGRQELLDRRIDRFEGYYRSLWTSCSQEEQLVLVQLAEEGFLNPKQALVARQLLQRGLLVRDPALRLMESGFCAFVQRVHDRQEVKTWEQDFSGPGWSGLRWGFTKVLMVAATFVAVVISLFLFATQQQLQDAAIGVVSIAAVAVPILLKLVDSVRRRGRL
jgi:hypothetical protein